MLRRRRLIALFVLVLSVIAGAFYESTTTPVEQTTPVSSNVVSEVTTTQTTLATAALNELAVKGRSPKTGYDRAKFSNDWGEISNCSLRELILQRDLDNEVINEDGCRVMSGTLLADPYTTKTIPFQRGAITSQEIQIDHVVAVSDAWQKGAQQLSPELRYQFYNDPLNLLAVDGPTNNQKGDGDAATWLPPNKDFRCRYVARQVAVKLKYTLWVTQAEHDAIQGILNTCPEQILPLVSSV